VHSASQILQSLLEDGKSPLADSYLCYRLRFEWTQVIGEKLAPFCSPREVRKGVLYLNVPSSAWAQQIRWIEHELIHKLNTHVRRTWVKEIRAVVVANPHR